MPEQIEILIVENEDDQIELYTDAIDEYNESPENISIVSTIVKTVDDAKEMIRENHYDAAFIDLCLSDEGVDEEKDGKKIVHYIKKYARYPVYIVSGSLDEETSELSENKFIEEHDRDSVDTERLLYEVQTLFKTGITNVLGLKGFFEQHLDDIFWKHFAQSKEYWLQKELDGTQLKRIVSRYTLSHLFEYLETTSDSDPIQYDVAEMYISPVIKEAISPGDIVTDSDNHYLVLSPACDLAQGCENVILVRLIKLFELEAIQLKKERYLEAESNGKRGDLISTLQNYIKNNKDRYHFLPRFLEFDAHVADYQKITTLSYSDANDLTSVMSISPLYFKDVQSRFASYYARQGSPDFDSASLSQEYFESLTST